VALTALYMHDGSAATLEDVLDHCTGGRGTPASPYSAAATTISTATRA